MRIKKKRIITSFLFCVSFQAYGQTDFQMPKQNDDNPTAVLQSYADGYLSGDGQTDHVSGISLTAQCDWKKHAPQPITIRSGYTGCDWGTKDKNGAQVKCDNYHPMDKDSVSQIGSITKSFASVVMLQLADEKNFSIDDPIEKWFPEYPNWTNVTNGTKVTIRQLMDMTSGIDDYFSDEKFTAYYSKHTYEYFSLATILAYEKDKVPAFNPPKPKWKYSNTTYTLLGLLIQKITGNDPGVEIKSRIIDKLQLNHTYYIKHLPTETVPYDRNLVRGYYYGGFIDFPQGTETTFFTASAGNTAGGIISNSEDINKYIHALFNSKTSPTDQEHLLTTDQLKNLTSFISLKSGESVKNPTPDDPIVYGLGVGKRYDTTYNQTFYWYAGATFGYVFEYYYYPERNISVVIPFNALGTAKDGSIDHRDTIFNNAIEYMMKNCAYKQ